VLVSFAHRDARVDRLGNHASKATHMSLPLKRAIALSLLGLTLSAFAFDSNIPSSGLPTATMYGTTLLPELQGVVSWRTLAQVEPVKQGAKMVPRFSKELLALDGQRVRVQGFILPMDMGDQQKHFLISAVPPHCPFCMPAGPDAIVEVFGKQPIAYGFDPIIVYGKMTILKDDPGGLLYRLTEAEPVASRLR
jgi:hypothetical protein